MLRASRHVNRLTNHNVTREALSPGQGRRKGTAGEGVVMWKAH